MVEFAKEKINLYDPDSGKGYFQLTEAVYASPKTQVLLVNKVSSILVWLYDTVEFQMQVVAMNIF